MPQRVFETIRTGLEAFWGGATANIYRHDEISRAHTNGRNTFAKKIKTDVGDYVFILKRADLPFSETEISFGEEMVGAFQVLFNGFKKDEYAAHYRTALLSSLMDVTIAQYLRHEHRRAFWSIQRLIQLLKNLSYQRYEGTPVTTGFIIYRNQLQKFRAACNSLDFTWKDFKPNVSISQGFFKSPLTYRLIDGLGTYFMSNINMRVTGMVKFGNYGQHDAVDRLTHRDTFSLLKKAGSGAFAVDINVSSELEVMTCPDKIFIWRKGSWSLFDPKIFRSFLAGHLDAKELELLILTVYSLSKIRHGTIVLICDKGVHNLDDFKKGSVGGNDSLSRLLIDQVKDLKISRLKESGQLIRILSSDGMTAFNKHGELVDTGFIVDTSKTPDLVAGGGRTTAASAASLFGKVIKVSEDGPIELFEKGKVIYTFG